MLESENRIHTEERLSDRNQIFHNQFKTSRVLLQYPSKDQSKYIIYCPCYLRLEIQNFTELSLQNLNAKLQTTIKFDIDVTELPSQVKDLIKQKISLLLHHDGVIKLDLNENPQVTLKIRKRKGQTRERTLFGYRIRKVVTLKMIPSIFYTPFEILYLILSITINHIQIWEQDQIRRYQQILNVGKYPRQLQLFAIRFNIMKFKYKNFYHDKKCTEDREIQDTEIQDTEIQDTEIQDTEIQDREEQQLDFQVKIGYTQDNFFKDYDLAEKLLSVQYTRYFKPKRVRKKFQKINQVQKNCCCLWCPSCWCQCYLKIIECIPKSIQPSNKDNDKRTLMKKKEIQDLKRRNKKSQKSKINPYRHAHFQLPVYRHPLQSLCTVFGPVWLLGLISLAVFFQDNVLADRIASLATIFLAHIAFIPVIRDKLPPTPSTTFIQYLIFWQIVITILCLIESFIIATTDLVIPTWNEFFIVSLTIQCITGILILWLVIRYLFWKLPTYNIAPGQQILLNPPQWFNPSTDKYFKKKIKINDFNIQEYPNRGEQILQMRL